MFVLPLLVRLPHAAGAQIVPAVGRLFRVQDDLALRMVWLLIIPHPALVQDGLEALVLRDEFYAEPASVHRGDEIRRFPLLPDYFSEPAFPENVNGNALYFPVNHLKIHLGHAGADRVSTPVLRVASGDPEAVRKEERQDATRKTGVETRSAPACPRWILR